MPSAKPRWKFYLRRSSSSSSTIEPTPMSYICPISSSVMSDPVVVPTGDTFERACIEACREFNFTPPSLLSSSSSSSSSPLDLSSPSFLLIPNIALKSAISQWCSRAGVPFPPPVSQESARSLVAELMAANSIPNPNWNPQPGLDEDEDDSIKKRPPPILSPPSSSSSCSYNSSSSSSVSGTSSSSEIVIAPSAMTVSDPPPVEEILANLKNSQTSVKESGLLSLRHSARESSDSRISLCTPRLLATVVPMLVSKNPSIQINATAAVVNLSIEAANKVKIVRSGAVLPLVDTLRCGYPEARDNAAGALFSLALEEENKLAIGVLGAIPPLVHHFCDQSVVQPARIEAGMALYHLSLASNNLCKIAKTVGAVKALMSVATSKVDDEMIRLQRVAMVVLASLARKSEGRVALMDADAVRAMVGMMRGKAGKEEEYCLAIMYGMSKGISLRFRALAKVAGAEEVLRDDKEGRGEVGKEMARRILKVIRGDEERGVVLMLGDEEDEEKGSVVSDGLVSFRRRYHDFGILSVSGSNSSEF